MSLRFLLQQRVPRFFVRRHFATSMKEYESLYDVLEVDPSCTKVRLGLWKGNEVAGFVIFSH